MTGKIGRGDGFSAESLIWDAVASFLFLLVTTLVLLGVGSVILVIAAFIGLVFYVPRHISQIQYEGIDSRIIAGYYVALLAFVFVLS